MTISTTSSSVVVAGNGSTTTFAFSFVGGQSSWIYVIYTDADGNQTTLSPTAYTLSLNAPAAGQIWGVGGTVTYPLSGAAIPAGTTLLIGRSVPIEQLISVSNQGNFYPASIEQAMDTLCMEGQQTAAATSRAIQVNGADSPPSPLPPAVQRANTVLGFDADGALTLLVGISGSLPIDVSSATVMATGGSATRTLATRFDDVLNVKDFGALGNGVADDTAAIQAAVNASHIFMPPGFYVTSSPIVVPSSRTISARRGTAFLQPSATFAYSSLNGTVAVFVSPQFTTRPPTTPGTLASDITFSGVAFDLSNWNTNARASDGIYMVGVSRLTIEDCDATGGMSLAQIVNCATVAEFANRHVGSYGNASFDHWAGNQDVRIIGCVSLAPNGGNAINFNGSDGSGTDTRTSSDLVVMGGQFDGAINLDTLGSECTVTNVLIRGTYIANPYGIYGRGTVTNVTIIGNVIDVGGTSLSHGIWIDQGSAAGGSVTGNPSGTTVVGNVLRGFTNTSHQQNGMMINDTTGFVTANVVTGTVQFGLSVPAGAVYFANSLPAGAYGAGVEYSGAPILSNFSPVNAPTLAQPVTQGATATGTNLATAYPLTTPLTYFNTVASGTGCALPANAAAAGQEWTVWNFGTYALTVYAAGSDTIKYAASTTITAGAALSFVSAGNGLWVTK